MQTGRGARKQCRVRDGRFDVKTRAFEEKEKSQRK